VAFEKSVVSYSLLKKYAMINMGLEKIKSYLALAEKLYLLEKKC
jgi:hypothetical protein